ncbi:MAG: cbb3-type cytochrome oxidase assembly protein CcoS [Bacteroidetes bacterium]|nr:cbb3-type cytochrome oxidase assembly protein CcoS [Bacteroidota bacterium]
MSVIIILVIVGIVVTGLFLIGFIWSVKSGQYDDMYSPSVRILFDDDDTTTIDIEKISTPEKANSEIKSEKKSQTNN